MSIKHKSLKYAQAKAVLSHISDGVVILDKDLTIDLYNKTAAKIIGWHTDEALGKKYDQILKVVHQNRLILDDKTLLEVTASKKKKDFPENTILLNKKGEKILIDGGLIPYKNTRGGIDGVLVIIHDITKEKEVDLMKTEFTSLASHQLRTPLTAIRWFIEELYNEQLGKINYEQKDYLKQILDSNTRMIKLVNDLLDVARLESRRVSVEPVSTNLIKLAEEVLKDYMFIARANNCQVVLTKPENPLPRIKIDRSLVKEVLSNLISNAVKYSGTKAKKGGSIVYVNMEKKEPDILISVKDSGVGIPKSFYNQIFQKFSRADNVTKIDTGGTGFGLYITKLLIEISGGKIWFISQENKGTTFYFTLPLAGSKPKKGDKGLVSEEEGSNIKV